MVQNCMSNSMLCSHLGLQQDGAPFLAGFSTCAIKITPALYFPFPSSSKGTILLLPLSSLPSCPWQFVQGPAQPFVVFLGSSPSIPAVENRTPGLEAFGGCIFDVQAEPCWLQACRDLGVAVTSCPYREIHGRRGWEFFSQIHWDLFGRFLRASQVSGWAQTTVSNVVVGDKPRNIWGGKQSLHPARNHLTKSWCANGLGPIIFD